MTNNRKNFYDDNYRNYDKDFSESYHAMNDSFLDDNQGYVDIYSDSIDRRTNDVMSEYETGKGYDNRRAYRRRPDKEPKGSATGVIISSIAFALVAVVCNLAARAASLWTGSWLIGPIPDGYRRSGFVALFTWGGLRGGLSLALAVSTASIIPEETYVIILGCTYAIVFFTTVVQGLTMKKVFQSISEKTISARE